MVKLSDTYLEKNISQQPAIDLLCKLGYHYISPEECMRQREDLQNVILTDVLRQQLYDLNSFEYGGKEYKFSSANIEKAISDLDEPMSDGPVRTSEKIYDHLMLGRTYVENLEDGSANHLTLNMLTFLPKELTTMFST